MVTERSVCFGFQINASQLCPLYSLYDHTSHTVKGRLAQRETREAVSRARAGAPGLVCANDQLGVADSGPRQTVLG